MNDDTEVTRADVRNLFGPPPAREIPEDDSEDAALKSFVRRLFAVGEDD